MEEKEPWEGALCSPKFLKRIKGHLWQENINFSKLTRCDLFWATCKDILLSEIRLLIIYNYHIPFTLKSNSISSCYRTVPSAVWEILSEFLIFCNLFHEPLGE